MENLAGVDTCDDDIRKELERCRIPIVEVERSEGEVPFTLIGQLGKFKFTRAWYYWIVEGLVPIEVAEELYADPVGKEDIRVDGFAGNIMPHSRAEWITDDGRNIFPASEEEKFSPIIEDHPGLYDKEPIFSDDPESLGAKLYVTGYHIDSEIGLRIFADTLRAHNLAEEVVPA